MDGPALTDRIYKGMGVAARRLGSFYIVYRPTTSRDPLSSRNRVIKLTAVFSAGSRGFAQLASYGDAIWSGVFDASYTQPGDYLVGAAGTFFVAAQAPLLPVECIKTNRVLTIIRPALPLTGGYSGLVVETALDIDAGWPASVLALSARISGNIPDTRFGSWSVLLPPLPASPQAGDVLIDDTGRNFVVGAAELSDLGWRLTAREVAG